jgi:hypothetical protein
MNSKPRYLIGFVFLSSMLGQVLWQLSNLQQVVNITRAPIDSPRGDARHSGTATSTPTTAVRLWHDRKFSYVQSEKYIHSYPLRQSNNVSLEVAIASQQHDDPQGSIPHDGTARSNTHHNGQQQFAIRVVYFVNTKVNPNYAGWFYHQLSVLGRHPALREIHVVADAILCSNETSLHEAFRWLVETRGYNETTKLHLECHDGEDELYEYHGVRKVWEIGQNHPGDHDVAVYLHTKGVTHASTWEEYSTGWLAGQAAFTEAIFSNSTMGRILEAFQLFPTVVMAGWDCAPRELILLHVALPHASSFPFFWDVCELRVPS